MDVNQTNMPAARRRASATTFEPRQQSPESELSRYRLVKTCYPENDVRRITESMATFECPICLEDAVPNPALTPCGHLLCWECLQRLEKQGKDKITITCPVCRDCLHVHTCWKAFCYVFAPETLDVDERTAIAMNVKESGGVWTVGVQTGAECNKWLGWVNDDVGSEGF
ncbi:hypothetical protein EJ02DRAFT_452841 [Clathrospora elynae]|uniref:RING-type E3 ubiquitin transferase n=1 Tax=Clathrospora elynae TaxID=706981 RepID=A0A6A5SVS9_9PLEO|nr:hypothetical protein EJ02DRAFT_452841 [Clathrospora elynae]